MSENTNKNNMSTTLLWVAVLVLGGVFLMDKFGDGEAKEDTSAPAPAAQDETKAVTGDMADAAKDAAGEGYFTLNGETWVKVNGGPVPVTVLNDPDCGAACSTAQALSSFKQNVSPALVVKEVDVNSAEGQALVDELNLKSVPSYVFGPEVKDTDFFATGAAALVPNGDRFVANPGAMRLPRGKFITPPEFDFSEAYTKGDGPVNVVEFFAFECGYCGKFATENKDTIDQLAEEGKITFSAFHFPLWGKENHIAAECFGQQGKWFEAHDRMFEDKGWSQSTDGGAEWYAALGAELGIDMDAFEACKTDPATVAILDAQQAVGRELGVTGTPGIIIGGQFVPGAIPPSTLIQKVEEESA